jgi:hypothetical protein
MGPAPRAQRKPDEGPIALAPRPSRNSGARVKGTYDVPDSGYVYTVNGMRKPPRWVDEPGGLFVTWGSKYTGSSYPFNPADQFAAGVTLWSLDENDNPVRVDQVDAYPGLGAFDKFAHGDYLGDGYDAGFQIYGRDHVVVTRVILGTTQIETTPQFQARAWRVLGSSLVQGDLLNFQLFTTTQPAVMNDPNFIKWLYQPKTAGLTQANALLASFADSLATYPSGGTYFVLYTFDPFDLAGSLLDLAVPSSVILRQPNVIHDRVDLGLPQPNVLDWRFSRRTDTEAVATFLTYNTSWTVDGQVHIVRFDSAGGILSTTTVPGEPLEYPGTPPLVYMGSDTAMIGGLRITDDDAIDVGLDQPFYSGFVTLQSYQWPIDDDRYLFIRLDTAANPDVMTYTIRSVHDDSLTRVITSSADQEADAEVHAISQTLMDDAFGNVDESLFVTFRAPSAYNTKRQIITIELGAGRQAGTAQVITEDRRFHRFPQGRN